MKLIGIGVLAAMVIATSATAQPASPQQLADELAAADRAFASAGANAKLADSIGAMLIPDAVMQPVLPDFVIGREAIVAKLRSDSANAATTAQWSPVRVGVAADGTQGFTYGFMTIRETGKADRRDKYLSYWVKRPEGWRVAFYKRSPSSPGEVATAMRAPALPAQLAAVEPQNPQSHRDSLQAAEEAFSDRAQEIGVGDAFVEFGSADAMNLGSGSDFTFGNVAIGTAFGANSSKPKERTAIYWSADKGTMVASSGDLGLNWGYIRLHSPPADGKPSAFAFFTIWRRAAPDQPWRYVAE